MHLLEAVIRERKEREANLRRPSVIRSHDENIPFELFELLWDEAQKI